MFSVLNDNQIRQYLDRIDLGNCCERGFLYLQQLVRAQLTHVPFENLDIWVDGSCPCLDTDVLFEKIIVRRRGGYCFELNTLFRVLLNSLGYQAYQCIASLIHEDRIDPPAHNVIVCRLDGKKYLMDVGFGGPVPFGAIELREGIFDGFSLRCEADIWFLERIDGTKPAFCFRDIPAELRELEPLNFYISQKPDSHFRHILRCNLRHPDGTVCTLVDDCLQLRHGDHLRSITVEDYYSVLQAYFNMDPHYIKLKE